MENICKYTLKEAKSLCAFKALADKRSKLIYTITLYEGLVRLSWCTSKHLLDN